ncbi:glycosyltransferase, partial [Escherichia coli]|nr:glycosyltransferase [Escherichia coli]
LPVVVSPAAGAVADLAVDGHNAIVPAGLEPGAWSAAIRRMAQDEAARAQLGAAARRTIRRRWTISHAVESMVAGLRAGALQAA